MADQTNKARERLLTKLTTLAGKKRPATGRKAFVEFLRLYYAAAPMESLSSRSPDELLAIAGTHWDYAKNRKPGETLIRVYTPTEKEHGWTGPNAVVETVVEDMPFLVDSLSIAIRKFGSGIDWLIHPVISSKRSAAGKLSSVSAPANRTASSRESFVHIQFGPLGTKKAHEEFAAHLARVIDDLRAVVDDFDDMRERIERARSDMAVRNPRIASADMEEADAFMEWLMDDHFTFLGYCAVDVRQRGKKGAQLVTVAETGLGLLRQDRPDPDSDAFSAPSSEISKYAQSPRVLVVTKGNSRSELHHDEYMDVVAIKRVNKAGRVTGVHRFVGLFSADAYATSPRLIPVLRRKLEYVMERSGLRDQGHAAKNLRDVLETMPRDELFQSSEEDLYETTMGIWALKDLQQLRLFMRRDRYGRFYSCMVILPRDRYSRQIRDRMREILGDVFQSDRIDIEVDLPRGGTARAMFIVRTPPGTEIPFSAAEIESKLLEGTRSWSDQLRDALTDQLGVKACSSLWGRFRDAFSVAYTDSVSADEAAPDVIHLDQLGEGVTVLPRLIGVDQEGGIDHLDLKLYVRSEPLPLSDILPTLENFGLHVESQRPFKVTLRDGEVLWVQDFDIRHKGTVDLPEAKLRELFESAFLKTWHGQVENDGINKLVLGAGLDWRQASLLRTICKYLLQTGMPFSQQYMEGILAQYGEIARLLVELFETRFTPGKDKGRDKRDDKVNKIILEKLDDVSSLDADRVLRGFLCVIDATLRTNYYQPDVNGESKSYISLKLDPKQIPELPKPLPMFETFVYAPEVEGVHLRGGKVARGGLRWSDRREDFRTEVLGLMKAQMVKNAVIVPVGAKGGFVVKKSVDPRDRETFMATGIACYKTFLSGILDITDNLVDGKNVPPKQVVRRDPDDAYLVVAADKGTATFSDIANGVSADYGFWLGDAFASGGSAGYDHKKMGITARGAWESVKRHFHEMGRNCQEQDFTVVGIGDMGGDVFGNGMLLSKHIKLVAAFNHMHIFMDPDPDPETSYIERERMFYLPRSSWEDYNKKLISRGGGIYSRSLKSIPVSPQMRKVLDIDADALPPTKLMNAMLKAPVDLLWNGGIGTYVKSVNESHLDVGDRANDNLRVNGKDLRCKVVGEGGNLGLTQLGRIEFAVRGGRINTDAIDNSGGVNSSDREVNIKIPLNELLLSSKIQLKPRNKLLSDMTKDLEDLVLYDNYVQSQAISLIEIEAKRRIDEHANLMKFLERDGLLERAIEYLPDEEQLNERRNNGTGLSRPEISVLLSYSKISLYEALLESGLPDDPFLEAELLENFPRLIRKRHAEALKSHRLRREIIATILTNLIVNRMGMAFAHRLSDEQGVKRAAVVQAFSLSRYIYDADRYWKDIEKLDGKVPTDIQYRQLGRVAGLMKHSTTWLLANASLEQPLEENVARYADGIAGVEKLIPAVLPAEYRAEWNDRVKRIKEAGVPDRLSTRMANTQVLGSALDIVELMHESGVSLEEVAKTYFLVGERFSILWLLSSVISLEVAGRWQALARATLRDDTYRLHRLLARSVLRCDGKTPQDRLQTWSDAHGELVQFGLRRLNELKSGGVTDFLGLSVAVRELRKFRLL